MDAVISVTSGGFFGFAEQLFHILWFFLFTLALAIHLQMIVL